MVQLSDDTYMYTQTPSLTSLGGVEFALCGHERNPGAPVIFAVHGRGGRMDHMLGYCQDLVDDGYIVITLDQRNHGRRIVDPTAYDQANFSHFAMTMYGDCLGTTMDISLIMDLLPVRYGIATARVGMTGISMGGHATLLAMGLDSRIAVGVPIIGSGDYRHLMELRLASNGVPADQFAAYYPDTFQRVVEKYDPIHHPARYADRPLLMLNGEADDLVQIACNERFLAAVQPHYTQADRLRLSRYPGVGHAVPAEMWAEARAWFTTWL